MEIDWREDALCVKFDPEVWFKSEYVEDAKAVCRQCPVIRDCLAVALRNKEAHGVWGGVLFAAGTTRRKRSLELRKR